jgi:hypothetical protein
MNDSLQDILLRISNATPANEAEVETKIILHIFNLLGYTDIDRADKPSVSMYFGREKKTKTPDFIFYNGSERTLANALITVEAKAVGEDLQDAENQAKSYASWAGTPYYVACNGELFKAALFIPSSGEYKFLIFEISQILKYWDRLDLFLHKGEVIAEKERLEYISYYLPKIEDLPANEFFKEYLERIQTRFYELAYTNKALQAPIAGTPKETSPNIPVTVSMDYSEYTDKELSECLLVGKERIFVVGDAGSGKSTLSRRVLHHTATIANQAGSNIIPIFVSLSTGIPVSLLDALQMSCDEMGVRVFPTLFQIHLKKSHIVLIMDGLDELTHLDKSNLSTLEAFTDSADELSILLTSRPIEGPSTDDPIVTYRQGTIRGLNDRELSTVLQSYLTDPNQMRQLLELSKDAKFLNIRSPIIALMLIRVLQTGINLTDFRSFSLYKTYISVLHQYFNSDTVRGRGEKVTTEQILKALSEVALILKQSETGIKFDELVHELNQTISSSHISALINIGLITVHKGNAILIHKSFEEFAIAWYMLDCIRLNKLPASIVGLSQASFMMANSGISEVEEIQLKFWLTRSKLYRRRACSIIRYGCSPEILNQIKNLINQEKDEQTWSSMAQVMLLNNDYSFMDHLIRSTEKLNHSKKSTLNWLLRRVKDPDAFEYAFKLVLQGKADSMIVCVFHMALALNLYQHSEQLIQLFNKSNKTHRNDICSILGKYRESDLGLAMSKDLIMNQKSLPVLINLLNIYRKQVVDLDSTHYDAIYRVLSKGPILSPTNKVKLRRFTLHYADQNKSIDFQAFIQKITPLIE